MISLLLTVWAWGWGLGTAQGAPTSAILDKDAILARHTWDNRDFEWYKQHIPFFESPDAAIDATYYYRWELVTKHLTYGSPETGYTFTEFIDRPSWSGAYGAISCPLGHQMYEIRWLKDHPAVEDFARYWFETPGADPRSYSNWYGDAVWATYMVTADKQYLRTMLPHMEAQYAGWMAEHWDSTQRMFRWDGMHDGMETNINSRLTADQFSGAEGYRPTINSYLYADARAISQAAALLGDRPKGDDYAARATDLKQRVQHQLWDPSRNFFFHQFAHDEKDGIQANTLTYRSGRYAGNPHGREEIGFVPWQFNLPDAGYESAWRFLMDTAYFFSAHGPTTVERHDPQFLIAPRCCVWSGNEWPYATTQTLVAMANLLNNYKQSVVTAADYAKLFKVYTLDQRKDGKPYIAEAANPDNGSFDGHNTPYHSEHYFHSGYVDLVITGIAGLRPRADDSIEVNPLAPADWNYFALDDIQYHGHHVSIVWDRDGTRYKRGTGLSVLIDGRVGTRAARLGRLVAYVGPARPVRAPDHAINLAVNNGHAPFPSITTSYSAPGTSPSYLNDGNYWYHTSPPNRWTTTGSPNATDSITLDFGTTQRIDRVSTHFVDDSSGVHPPARYTLQMWRDNGWVVIPGQRRAPVLATGRQANNAVFAPVTTSRLLVVLQPRPGAATGVTEIEAWGHDQPATKVLVPRPANFAWGASPSASFTSQFDSVDEVNDGVVAFTHYSRNRWTAFGTANTSDWVQLDFPAPRLIAKLELFLWGDGSGVKAPRRYTIQTWNGTAWVDAKVKSQVPLQPQVSSVNTVHIAPVTTTKLRMVFEHDAPAATGVTELKIWGSRP